MYKREATQYDTDYVKKYEEDLNTTLIFAGLFSAISSAFVIDVHSNLQPDPNEQSAALLRSILLTLNQSAIPGETPAVLPVQEDPPSEIVIVTGLMYASLLISLLAAFVAMLGKEWLNRYLRNSGGSTIERCGDRQLKCDGLEKWPLHFFVESLPVMLQVSLLLLACGLCRYMWSINVSIAYILIGLTSLGVVFYIAIVIAGTSSYACPFQTPTSFALRSQWKKLRREFLSYTVHSKPGFSWIHQVWNRRVRPFLRRQSPPTTVSLGGVQIQQPEPWLKPKDLTIIRQTNADDARCVSWILRNITDPEALDTAIRLTGEIRWFDDGINVDPPYDSIVSTFETCFDSTRRLYPGLEDRMYYSGRAMMWIHTLAMCKSEEFARIFPLPTVRFANQSLRPHLKYLLEIYEAPSVDHRHLLLSSMEEKYTPSHSHWASNILLHLSWANRTQLNHAFVSDCVPTPREITVPLNSTLNRLLAWCIFFSSPVDEEALKVQDKSDRMERILRQLSKAIISAIKDTHTKPRAIWCALCDLTKLESRPQYLVEMAYEWCSVMCENHQRLLYLEKSLLVSLEIGFQPPDSWGWSEPRHTEHHQKLIDVVFKSRQNEAIADLLCAWAAVDRSGRPEHGLLGSCVGHLVNLHSLVPFSPRLRRLVIHSVKIIGYKGFEGVAVGRFIELLNHLHVTAEDIDERDRERVALLILDTLQNSEGSQHLFHWYWELLVELIISMKWPLRWKFDRTCNPHVTRLLIEAQEWSKLECWVEIVSMLWPSEADGMEEEDPDGWMLLLFRQRPGAAQRLNQWMERCSQKMDPEHGKYMLESFQQICRQVLHKATQLDAPLISSTDEGTEHPTRTSLSGGNETFWELLPYRTF